MEWLLKNVAGNNGRAGFVGTSYPGFLAMEAGIDPHPAVKAISPQAPMIDVWMGDDFFHNGAFRQTYGYDYVFGLETSKESTDVSYGKDKSGKPRDGFDYFLERGSFEEDVKRSGSKMLPTWKLFLEHPAYDLVWSSRGVEHDLNTVAVPTLTVGGYYDQEDMYGPQVEYATLEPHDAKHENFLVLGPWRHGSWSFSSRHLGNLDYGEPIGKEFRAQIEAKFFAHYLKDEPGFDLEDTASFQTGSNTWKRYAHFPPKESAPTSLHLEGDGKLGWSDSPAPAKTTYVSDPANPVPYRHRPIQPTYSDGSQWFDWLTEDQRFVTGRPDVAVWKLPVLKKDLVVTGEVTADIFASTTGTDNDMVVKLIDEYPADDPDEKMRGYQLMTNEEIFRGRYLDSFAQGRPLRRRIGARIPLQPARCRPRLQGRAHGDGGDPEHLVPALRSQPADVCAQHHDRQAGGLQAGDDHHLLRPRPRLKPAGASDECLRSYRVLLSQDSDPCSCTSPCPILSPFSWRKGGIAGTPEKRQCPRFCISFRSGFATIEVEARIEVQTHAEPTAPKPIRFRYERFKCPKTAL